jgi:dephospho-CoA kinase
MGIPTIDSDSLAREAVAPGSSGLAEVVGRFGPDVLGADGSLDRQKLAAIVFSDADARRALEAIVHPEVRRATEAWFASLSPDEHACAVADIPLLYETGRDRDFDVVVVVACDAVEQVRRAMLRDGLSEEDARRRIAAQLPIDAKVQRADYVIRTDGPVSETDRQVEEVAAQLRQAAAR